MSVTIQGEQVYLPHTLQPHWRRGCGIWGLERGHGSPQVPAVFPFSSLYAFLCSFSGVQKTIISSPLPLSEAMRLYPTNDIWAEEGPPQSPFAISSPTIKATVEMAEPQQRWKLNPCVRTHRAAKALAQLYGPDRPAKPTTFWSFARYFSTAKTELTDLAPSP